MCVFMISCREVLEQKTKTIVTFSVGNPSIDLDIVLEETLISGATLGGGTEDECILPILPIGVEG
jgi:hypothetical protein